jgi:hypothetical protein
MYEWTLFGKAVGLTVGVAPDCQSRARKVGNLAIRPTGMTEVDTEVMTRMITHPVISDFCCSNGVDKV